MKNFSLTLYLEINNSNFVFSVGESDDQDTFKVVYTSQLPLEGIDNFRISNYEKFFSVIKKNLYIIEQKLNHTFNEIILIVENFNPTFINLSGYKRLSGSQILRENITYILNILKSCVEKVEKKKKILHIFNSNFYLDKKKIENIPIGLFGDFYSHELSFNLIDANDYKNLENVFTNCNLKLRKTLLKSFITGAYLSNTNNNIGTFFQITLNKENSKIFLFENDSLKYEQTFKFGSNLIIKDISKVTSLNINTVTNILSKIEFKDNLLEDEILDKQLFVDEVYRKIKKNLVYDIVEVRIKELLELIVIKNINLKKYYKDTRYIFIKFTSGLQFRCLDGVFKTVFSNLSKSNLKPLDDIPNEDMLKTAHKIVNYGWKKEAIPVSETKKSIIARFFDAIFG